MTAMDFLNSIDEFKRLFATADHIDIATVDCDLDLESFLIRIFSYRPGLIRLLYRIRAPLVRLLDFKQAPLPDRDEWVPTEFPMLPCGQVWLFTVQRVSRGQFWIAGCPRDRHLDADMAVAVRPLQGQVKRFYLVTVVRYKHWTGPLYFSLIRIFNHFLINRMARYATRLALLER